MLERSGLRRLHFRKGKGEILEGEKRSILRRAAKPLARPSELHEAAVLQLAIKARGFNGAGKVCAPRLRRQVIKSRRPPAHRHRTAPGRPFDAKLIAKASNAEVRQKTAEIPPIVERRPDNGAEPERRTSVPSSCEPVFLRFTDPHGKVCGEKIARSNVSVD